MTTMHSLSDQLFRAFAARVPCVHLETDEPEIIYPLVRETFARFWSRFQEQHSGLRTSDPSQIQVWVWDLRLGLRQLAWTSQNGSGERMLEGDPLPQSAPFAAAVRHILAGLSDPRTGRDIYILTHPRPAIATNPENALALEALLKEINWSYAGPNRVILTGAVGDLPPMVANLVSKIPVPLPGRDDIRQILSGALQTPAGKVAPALVDAMLGLSYRQVSAGARQAATQKRDETAAVNQALEAKIAAIRTIAPFVDFLPAAVNPPPMVGMELLAEHVRQIKTVLEHPELGVSPGGGILLAGPPGTGKSSFVTWLSWYTRLPVMVFSFADMMKSLVGESESNLRRAILAANAMGAVIVMLDEIEKQAPNLKGAASDGGLGSRMLSMVLTWMQEAWDACLPILFVGTANTTALNHLPPEFFSRFAAIYAVDEPDRETLADIFRAHLSRLGQPDDYDPVELAERLTQVTRAQRKPVGRDVVQVIRQAQGRAAVERLTGVPEMDDLRAAIDSLREGLRDIGGGVMAKPIRRRQSHSGDTSSGVISLEE
jgi:hypothetical protein